MKFFVKSLIVIALLSIASFFVAYSFRVGIGASSDTYVAQPVHSPNGSIATSQPLASQAGMYILQSGGNAVDAAIAAAAVLSVVEPYMTGIGGDMFAILWSESEQKLIGIDGSGYAGSKMTKEKIGDRGKVPNEGAQSITLPGALAGWDKLLQTYGTMTLAEVLQPAIDLAENGFPIAEITASEWEISTGKLGNDRGARATFLINNERTPKTGEWFVNTDYAKTLKLIAAEGIGVFYGGSLGENIATRIQELGGFLTTEDFANYEAKWIEPVSVQYQNYRVWELPPNGQGIAALEMLKLLEPYDLNAMGHNSVDYLHLLIEAKKLAYANLEHYVGDPEFMQVTPAQLLADDTISKRRQLINENVAMPRADPDLSLTTSETTYLTVADREGNMVSLINSVAGLFGSGVVVPGTGFALQNRGVGLSMLPGRANSVAPGRRPFHTIIPGFVTKTNADGSESPWLSFGIVGGPQQPQAHVQLLLNLIVFDMDLQQAIDAPRFRHWEDNNVSFEATIPESIVEELMDMGHAPQNPFLATAHRVFLGNNRGLLFGGGQAIMKVERGYIAASDSRRIRAAAGY